MRQISAYGVSVAVPTAWECRIMRRIAAAGEQTHAVVHLANFALPEQRDDFGGNVTATMGPTDVFAVLFEYGPASANRALFRAQGRPVLTFDHFGARRLQRPRPNQLGCQQFFTENGRAFCLYVVAGSRAALTTATVDVNASVHAMAIAHAEPAS
ncbi:MAG TPA: hypothetical protein VH914_20935 [Acidimicrobiia bacterium]|jgi:hypothetical protein|nr:hypothetical protein [Acidimicrobiia bacterium]